MALAGDITSCDSKHNLFPGTASESVSKRPVNSAAIQKPTLVVTPSFPEVWSSASVSLYTLRLCAGVAVRDCHICTCSSWDTNMQKKETIKGTGWMNFCAKSKGKPVQCWQSYLTETVSGSNMVRIGPENMKEKSYVSYVVKFNVKYVV